MITMLVPVWLPVTLRVSEEGGDRGRGERGDRERLEREVTGEGRSEGRSEGGEGVERSEGVCSPHTQYQRLQTPGRLQTRETTRKRQSVVLWWAVPWEAARSSVSVRVSGERVCVWVGCECVDV